MALPAAAPVVVAVVCSAAVVERVEPREPELRAAAPLPALPVPAAPVLVLPLVQVVRVPLRRALAVPAVLRRALVVVDSSAAELPRRLSHPSSLFAMARSIRSRAPSTR